MIFVRLVDLFDELGSRKFSYLIRQCPLLLLVIVVDDDAKPPKLYIQCWTRLQFASTMLHFFHICYAAEGNYPSDRRSAWRQQLFAMHMVRKRVSRSNASHFVTTRQVEPGTLQGHNYQNNHYGATCNYCQDLWREFRALENFWSFVVETYGHQYQ